MLRFVSILALTLVPSAGSVHAVQAASFDCTKAVTPFERAICENPELSVADQRLAVTYETATGGLSDLARGAVRTGQREWLSYAQRACTKDARPLTTGTYDERGVSCLLGVFSDRSALLEQSRMIDGRRFFPMARYEAFPDPYEADNPDSWFPVARHELSWVELDDAEGPAQTFNDMVRKQGDLVAPASSEESDPDADEGEANNSDTRNTLFVHEVVGQSRISIKARTYWYGHGAAHGNWSLTYRHYLVEKGRLMEAGDLLAGAGWEKALQDLALKAAKAEHGDNLMLDDPRYLTDVVADPERWDLSDPYALIIQFQPYEIAAYAYGAPNIRVRWEDLEPYLAEGAYEIR
ncbi:DUF3298 domain-containing protein [Devosia faecipullorum]|uniref:DUF3298 domain-containing protein n=1 Tax=Devosia faecipullorum TaxID=2755039 RepID=UPI00187B6484|nr:DUF3298 domain-containing protein [Devosia faecipullorum]MBE7733032.1 DUF3298 domain-containing protein [Devosia faecipullorum]